MSASTTINARPKAASTSWHEAKKRLEAARAELRHALEPADERSSVLEWPPPPGEYSAESAARDVEFGRREGILERLARIDGALERLRYGTYGRCDRCEGDIELRRLALDPAAQRCHTCQEASELGLRTPSL